MPALVQIAQHADDLDRAEDFYTRLLGAGPIGRFDPPGLLFFEIGQGVGGAGSGRIRLLLERGAAPALVYLGVTGLHARIEELRAAGVRIEGEPHVIFRHDDDRLGPAGTEEWHAFIRDSEDNLVGLVEHIPAS